MTTWISTLLIMISTHARYADPAALEAHRASHAAVCGLVTKLVKAAGGRNPLGGPGGGACLQLANIAKLVLRSAITSANYGYQVLTGVTWCSGGA